jgi:hypothetical protein
VEGNNMLSTLAKYVINRLIHGLFHIALVISLRLISSLGLKPSDRYQGLGMITRTIWKSHVLECVLYTTYVQVWKMAQNLHKKFPFFSLQRLKVNIYQYFLNFHVYSRKSPPNKQVSLFLSISPLIDCEHIV